MGEGARENMQICSFDELRCLCSYIKTEFTSESSFDSIFFY